MKIIAVSLDAWREGIENALCDCTSIAGVNALAKGNEAEMVDYTRLYPDKYGSLKARFVNKRAELAQALLGDGA